MGVVSTRESKDIKKPTLKRYTGCDNLSHNRSGFHSDLCGGFWLRALIMKKIIIITVSTRLFISQFSFGQKPVPWVADSYKVANPNELAYLLYYEIECGGDKD